MTSSLPVLQGTLELLILQALARGGEMHGFEILSFIRDGTDEGIAVEDGALYHALHRMAGRGWVAGDWGVSEKGRRARYYRLTSMGKAALAEESARWTHYVRAMAKLALGPSSG